MDKELLKMDNRNLAAVLEFEEMLYEKELKDNIEAVVEVVLINNKILCPHFYEGCVTSDAKVVFEDVCNGNYENCLVYGRLEDDVE